MNAFELIPCKCGSGRLMFSNPMAALYGVHCLDCGQTAQMGYWKDDAAKNWNRKMEKSKEATVCQN